MLPRLSLVTFKQVPKDDIEEAPVSILASRDYRLPQEIQYYNAEATPERIPSSLAVSVRRVAFQQVYLANSRQV